MESQNTGWIKLSRSITAHWIWDRPLYLKWWLDLVMMAGWDQQRRIMNGKLITVERGQFVASLSYLCERWAYRRETVSGEGRLLKPSDNTVTKFLRLLEGEGMITREPKNGVAAATLITICNYDKYNTISEVSSGGLRDSEVGAANGGVSDDSTAALSDAKRGGKRADNRGVKKGGEAAERSADGSAQSGGQYKNIRNKENSNTHTPGGEIFLDKVEEPPSIEVVTEYFKEIGTNQNFKDWKGAARKFFDYYQSSGWHDSNGKKIVNWKSRANLWLEEDKAKSNKKQKANGSAQQTNNSRRGVEPPEPGKANWNEKF